MSCLVISNYLVCFLTIVVGLVAFFTPSWFEAYNIFSFSSIRSGLALETRNGRIGYFVSSPFFSESSAIRTSIVLFPIALKFAFLGLLRSFQGQRYLKSNRFGLAFIQKVQRQALGFHIAAGVFLAISLVIYTIVNVPSVDAVNQIGNLRTESNNNRIGGGGGGIFISTNNRPDNFVSFGNRPSIISGGGNRPRIPFSNINKPRVPLTNGFRPSPPRSSSGNKRGSSSSSGSRGGSFSRGGFSGSRGGSRGRGKRNTFTTRQTSQPSASLGYSFYLGWSTLLFEIFAVILNALLTKNFLAPRTTDVMNMK